MSTISSKFALLDQDSSHKGEHLTGQTSVRFPLPGCARRGRGNIWFFDFQNGRQAPGFIMLPKVHMIGDRGFLKTSSGNYKEGEFDAEVKKRSMSVTLTGREIYTVMLRVVWK